MRQRDPVLQLALLNLPMPVPYKSFQCTVCTRDSAWKNESAQFPLRVFREEELLEQLFWYMYVH